MDKSQPPPYTENAMPQQQPPPPGFTHPPPQAHHAQSTVFVTMPTVPVHIGPESSVMMCPHCHHQVSTTVVSEPNTKTHLFALLLCLFVCWPCCCVPYCMDSCQSRLHSCPNCGAHLGTYDN